jgi:DNA replication protein DnaC
MMMNTTLAQLRELKLHGMASAVDEQLSSGASTALSFEERLALMVDREVHHRDDRRRTLLLKKAGLKYPQACIEDVDSRPGRGFERGALMSLALSRWVEDGAAILISGATGSGKSWLACALAQYACRRGHSALYLRTPRLAEELRVLHGNGGFGRWLAAVARTDVLLLDDWGLAALDGPTRADLMEVIDDRAGTRPTIVTSQLPVEHWHAWIGDATIADAILDRLLSRSQRITLRGESMRPGKVTSVDIKKTMEQQMEIEASHRATPTPFKTE